jgi:hypothetical protein
VNLTALAKHKPKRFAEVEYRDISADGYLRHGAFKELSRNWLIGVSLRDRAVGFAEAPPRGSSPFGLPSLTQASRP